MTNSLPFVRIFRTLYLLGVGILVWIIAPSVAVAQSGCEVNFTLTGGLQSWTVPPGVTSIRIEAAGGQGGNEDYCFTCGQGGLGARVAADFTVTPGEKLQIIVAGQGGGGFFNAGGGGASFIARGNNGFSDFIAANILLIGGGGAILSGSGQSSTVFQVTASGLGGSSDGHGSGGGRAGDAVLVKRVAWQRE